MAHPTLKSDIVLIGPIRSGKSTIGRLLAERLGQPNVSMDEVCWDYYREIGFYEPGVDVRGPDRMIASRYHLYALDRLLASHQGCVIDLGAGHSVHREIADLERMRKALAAHPNVFLLLPSPDPHTSAAVLAERNGSNDWLQTFIRDNGWNPNELFLTHPSNATLAKYVIFTEGKSPEQTCDEILLLTSASNDRPVMPDGSRPGSKAS